MKDILTIIKEYGLNIPDEKVEDFKRTVLENYKTVNELEGIKLKLTAAEQAKTELEDKYNADIAVRDKDLKQLKTQLEAAGTDSQALAELQTKFSDLSASYETAKNEYAQALESQKYEFLVKEATNNLKFSSNSAKKAFLTDALAKKLAVSDGQLMGFTDFVEAYKKTDADAFLTDKPPAEPNRPFFSGKSGGIDTPPSPAPSTTVLL